MEYFKCEEELENNTFGFTYYEVSEIAVLRQITQLSSGYISSNRKDETHHFRLAEADLKDIETIEEFIRIEKAEFDENWINNCKLHGEEWYNTKESFVIGAQVQGTIEVFYPQGIISCLDSGITIVADYDECRKNSDWQSLYPGHRIEGVVSGYDEENQWIIISNSKAY